MGGVELALLVAGGFLSLAVAAVRAGRRPGGPAAVYGAAAALSGLLALVGAWALLADGPPDRVVLPFGLPWLGAHFRLDALSGFFALLLGVGGGAASLYAIGYGRHERAPGRVLPFYAAFLGAMTLVLLADDAFSFLFAWELMSLLSWALVVADHRDAGSRQAAFVYLG
ncbi:MAG TPA: hydrogenase 4 subunit B, partial [Amaricoccus sp.]|nr:hydrogenase 4 subunit B [Amaricoccus sp.]